MKRTHIIIYISITLLTFCVIGLTTMYFQNRAILKDAENTLLALRNDMASMRNLSPVVCNDSESAGTDIADIVSPAVVLIRVSGKNFEAAGSGFIVDNTGYIVTNQHVIEDANSIRVTLSTGDTYEADLIDSDATKDMAVIKLLSDRTDFHTIKLGSASNAVVGESVMAVGYPIGLELPGPASYTNGIVSAIREFGSVLYIQTDAAFNTGNSGGPLINQQGMVLGMCTSIIGSSNPLHNVQGLGLAIHIGDVLRFINSGRVPCANCHNNG
jgi:S1-C subfamily serine protease